MAASPVNQLNAHISKMIATGLLDESFMVLRRLQDAEDPDFIAGLVTNFLNDSDRMFGELTQLLERPFMDFKALFEKLHELKGCSAGVCARQVKLACIQLEQFIGVSRRTGMSKWVSTLAKGRAAFDEVCSEFQTMIQLERQINGF
ncbi:hypothetical protein EJB05_49132 [Eragrostis curvula]|uniref:Histidine-containing phosphotransfer protein n=1 Tax=Eragrostis curvula TaxID=38414 RepID=A0A5J9T3I0_9POAL|nr:hypothetical protein EJB05_49132 [Eragrostis curvula]